MKTFAAITNLTQAIANSVVRSMVRPVLAVTILATPSQVLAADFRIEEVVTGLTHPWAVAELPAGGYVITERGGDMWRVGAGGQKSKIANVPAVFARSQGGLLDVVLDPDYADNQTIWFSYAAGGYDANSVVLAKAVLRGNALEDVTTIFDARPQKDTPVHYGGRIAFLPDGTVIMPTGDGFDYREQSQVSSSHLGKVIRLNRDGSVPADNPWANNSAWQPEIWTLGHRNPQGLIFDQTRQKVILHEHGPKGGDEINVLEAGKNYGWPIATHGVDYNGAQISPFKEYEGMENPILVWTPSIAPSGLAVYDGAMFPEWSGDFLVGALAARELRRVDMDGMTIKGQESLLDDLEARIRDVLIAKDGAILVLTDANEGKLIRLVR